MTQEPTNDERALWAKEALTVFTRRTFSGDQPETMHCDDLECAISDLICDLMHLARQEHFDVGSLLQQACSNFGCEKLDESLRSRREITIAWSTDDVSEIRPDLTDAQCWEVLRQAERQHDAAIGLSWDTLAAIAEELFGVMPDGGDQ